MKVAWILYSVYAGIVGIVGLGGLFLSVSESMDTSIATLACAAVLVPYLALSALERALE